ncbi:MAG: hypothetical protein R2824_26930 [Saprospiraceae bacterium]|nr:hypothetical protein [Lewinella sp.]
MKIYITLRYWAVLLIILFLTGCNRSLVLWNQATENFNQATSLETTNRFTSRLQVSGAATPPAEAVPDVDKLFGIAPENTGQTAEELYKKADQQITEALDTPLPLQKEGKLANARFLKALVAWKTGQAEAARANAALALEEFKNQEEPSPRDEALARAIPGLVALDEVYAATQPMIQQLKDKAADAPNMSETDAKALFTQARDLYDDVINTSNLNSLAGAKADFEAAMMKAGNQKEVITYLQLCEMAGLKNQFDLWSGLDNFAKRAGLKADNPDIRSWLDTEEERYLENKDRALDQLKEVVEGGTSNPAYLYWDRIL